MKKTLSALLKGLISILLLTYLFYKIDLKEVWQHLQQANIFYLLIAFGLCIIGQALCAVRWKHLARVMDFHNSLKEFVIYYFAGMFFSLFLPTLIGGDVAKCYYLARGHKKTLQAIISVLADRGTGLIALILIAWGSLFLMDGVAVPAHFTWGIHAAGIIMIAGLITPFFAGGLCVKLGGRVVELALAYWKRPGVLLNVILISFGFQMTVILIHILIGLSLGLAIPWKFYFFLVPVVAAVSMLPVSLSGLGVREGAYVYFLSLAGIPQTEALTFAFGWLFVAFASSLTGGLALFKTPAMAKQKEKGTDLFSGNAGK